jgi:hypothetical protein
MGARPVSAGYRAFLTQRGSRQSAGALMIEVRGLVKRYGRTLPWITSLLTYGRDW